MHHPLHCHDWRTLATAMKISRCFPRNSYGKSMKIRGSDPSSHQTNHQSSESTTCRTLVEFQIIVSIWSPKYNSKKCMAQDHLPASNMNGLTPKKKSCSERTDHELPSWTPTFASFTNSDPPSTSHSVSAAAGFNTTMSE